MSLEDQNEACAICLEPLKYRNKKQHRTNCGHCFHETCIEKIKEVTIMETLPSGETVEMMVLPCPCCRTPIDPTLKQKITQTRICLKRVSDNIHDYANVYNVQMNYHNDVIRNLEKSLRDAKNAKKIVHQELSHANRCLKNYQINLKNDLVKYYEEMKQEKNERKQMRNKRNHPPLIENQVLVNSVVEIPPVPIIENPVLVNQVEDLMNDVVEILQQPPPPPVRVPIQQRFRVVTSFSNI